MINCVKGLFQVNKTPSVDLQSSVALVISSTSSKIAKDVDIFFLNPCWLLYNICFLFRKDINLLSMHWIVLAARRCNVTSPCGPVGVPLVGGSIPGPGMFHYYY